MNCFAFPVNRIWPVQTQQCDVAMRFRSCESLLEDLGLVALDGIDWVIVGGEISRSKSGAQRVDRFSSQSVQDRPRSGAGRSMVKRRLTEAELH
jgi:protein gp37